MFGSRKGSSESADCGIPLFLPCHRCSLFFLGFFSLLRLSPPAPIHRHNIHPKRHTFGQALGSSWFRYCCSSSNIFPNVQVFLFLPLFDRFLCLRQEPDNKRLFSFWLSFSVSDRKKQYPLLRSKQYRLQKIYSKNSLFSSPSFKIIITERQYTNTFVFICQHMYSYFPLFLDKILLRRVIRCWTR